MKLLLPNTLLFGNILVYRLYRLSHNLPKLLKHIAAGFCIFGLDTHADMRAAPCKDTGAILAFMYDTER
jgi:hypothetical protein